MIKGLVIFGGGVYVGVYVAQNYQIDEVEDPRKLIERCHAFIKAKMQETSSKKD